MPLRNAVNRVAAVAVPAFVGKNWAAYVTGDAGNGPKKDAGYG